MQDIILLGAGGHAKSVVDVIEQKGKFNIIGFLDKEENRGHIVYKNYKVVGTDAELAILFNDGIQNAFISMGFMGKSSQRKTLFFRLKQLGYHIPTLIDRTAVLAEDVKIGEGCFVGKHAVINSAAVVGKMCIINTGGIVEHDNKIGDFTHIAVGAVLSGHVNVGSSCLIGAGSNIIQRINIGANAIVGAGAVVIEDVQSGSTVVGTPAKLIKRMI